MKYLFLILFSLFLSIDSSAQETEWLANLEDAQKVARKENKSIILNFSGSDWCGNCMRLEKDLFLSEEFLAFAEENLVLLNLDFPAKKANKLSDEQTEYNDKLAEKFNKKGVFPLTIIIDSNGEVIGEMKYPSLTVADYLANIQSLIE